MVRSSPRRESRWERRFFLFMGKKPSKVKRPVGWPEAARAATRAQGPGMGHTGIPRAAHWATSSSPGSEMAGIPASVTRAQFSPASSRSSTARAAAVGIVAVIGHHGLFQPQVIEQFDGYPCVFGGDEVRLSQGVRHPLGDIP